ncbi:MarR family transcriptional regulator [Myxococcaceae bacterium GXIMD 01537]
MSRGLPERVHGFLAEHIGSVEQLEVLLLLRRHPERGWSPEQVARELRIEPGSADKRLEDLERRGFVARWDGPGHEYVYLPGPPEREDTVRGLAEGYAQRRATVIHLIFSKPVECIRTFTEAPGPEEGEG